MLHESGRRNVQTRNKVHQLNSGEKREKYIMLMTVKTFKLQEKVIGKH